MNCYQLWPLKEIGTLKHGVWELMPQKRNHKNNLGCAGTSKRTNCTCTTKKIMEVHWN